LTVIIVGVISDLSELQYFACYNIITRSLRVKLKFRILYFDKYNIIILFLTLFVWFCVGVKPDLGNRVLRRIFGPKKDEVIVTFEITCILRSFITCSIRHI
jgi:hypothetical protein